jgi:hypothetical protein
MKYENEEITQFSRSTFFPFVGQHIFLSFSSTFRVCRDFAKDNLDRLSHLT